MLLGRQAFPIGVLVTFHKLLLLNFRRGVCCFFPGHFQRLKSSTQHFPGPSNEDLDHISIMKTERFLENVHPEPENEPDGTSKRCPPYRKRKKHLPSGKLSIAMLVYWSVYTKPHQFIGISSVSSPGAVSSSKLVTHHFFFANS